MTALDEQVSPTDWIHPADAAAAVAHVPLFATLGRREVRKIARSAEVRGFAAGDVVLGDGDPADFFYVVLDGAAKLHQDEFTRRLRPGDYFGATALVDAAAQRETVAATDALDVLRVPAPVLQPLVERNPSITYAILAQLGRRMQEGNRRRARRAA